MKIVELSLSVTPETLTDYLDDVKKHYAEDFIRFDKEYDNGVVAKFDCVHLNPVTDRPLYYRLLGNIEPYIIGNYGKRMRISNMRIHRYEPNLDYTSEHADTAFPDSYSIIVPLVNGTITEIGGKQYTDNILSAYIVDPLEKHAVPVQSEERYSLVVWFKEFEE